MQVSVGLSNNGDELEFGEFNQPLEFIKRQVPCQVVGALEATMQFPVIKPFDMG